MRGESILVVLFMFVHTAQKHNLGETVSIHLRSDTIHTCSKAKGTSIPLPENTTYTKTKNTYFPVGENTFAVEVWPETHMFCFC